MSSLFNALAVSTALSIYLGYKISLPNEFFPWYTRLFNVFKPTYPTHGKVKEGYEDVEELFKHHFEQGREVGSSVTAMIGDEVALELYGGYENFQTKKLFTNKSLTIVFSSSKFMEAVVIAKLVDQGCLDYDAKVSSYWPEFGQNGKENVTVADVLRHEGGLTYFNDPQPTLEVLYDHKKLGQFIETHPHVFNGDSVRAYHGLTRGLILNQIVSRVDPNNRNIGQIFKQELNPLLGIEFYLGLEKSLVDRKSKFYKYPMIDMLSLMSFPSFILGEKNVKTNFSTMKSDSILGKIMGLKISKDSDMPNSEDILDVEIPSVNGFTSAFSLAKTGAYFANGGSLASTILVSPEGFKSSISEPIAKLDSALQLETIMTKGGFGVFQFSELEEPLKSVKFYGWGGMGGSIILFCPEYKLSFSYVMNAQHPVILAEGRGFQLLSTFLKAFFQNNPDLLRSN